MITLTACSTSVAVCPSTHRREALLHLAAVHEPALQPMLQTALQSAKQAAAWEGLWVSQQQGRIDGAIWVQLLGNTTAQLWLPRQQGPVAQALLRVAYRWIAEQGITFCHTVLPPSHYAWEATLLALNMTRLAELHYLSGSIISGPLIALSDKPVSIQLKAFTELDESAQKALIDDVSQESLDCPGLREALSSEALLAGFYQKAPQAPHHWYSVHVAGQSVGVLLLSPLDRCWELLLMGVVREWRGKGIGREVLQAAFRLAAQQGATEMMLTVDALNTPALRLYQRAGLARYAEQRLLAWKAPLSP
ncbi:GNAT family N-acetyltransferase [Vreelandella zhanjiangensis]|uniref:GNAT family N-acetyltransferase n=1 Tax=Vreelandella zhanjiangensis TaxID=1121960 RepID=UPI00036B60EA|nr:GNAT family N-acetyltransferase [Halomonas zhanjiangensis]